MAETRLKVVLLAALTLTPASGLVAAEDADVEARYAKSCAVCHAAGAAGAPKTGVAAEWEARLAKGMDELVKSVEVGLNAMPPKGMCFDCSAEDYRLLIEYMAVPR